MLAKLTRESDANDSSSQGQASDADSDVVVASEFLPPRSNDTPRKLFRPVRYDSSFAAVPRWVRRACRGEMLVFTDGACSNNGAVDASAGCGVIYGPDSVGFSFRLERCGPTGRKFPQTSNRAELRAVIAALQLRPWYDEGFYRIVVATDSEYVVKGITEWTRSWISRGWVTCANRPVKNRDLWECLLAEIKRYHEERADVLFWRIPRALNVDADRLAVRGSREEVLPNRFQRMILG